MNSRQIFIGDVHGCFDEFILLLEKIKITSNDKIYLAGDFINKGPKSYEVLEFLDKNKDNFFYVIGNNEVNFLKWIESGKLENHKVFNDLYKKIKDNNSFHLLDLIIDSPIYIEEDDFILLHGGLIPGKKLEDHNLDEITRLREYKGELWYKNYKGNKKVIYGHNAKDGLQIREKTIGLDSGCVYGKSLTAYILNSKEIYSQNAFCTYENIR